MAVGGAGADLEMVDNPDLGRDLVPVHQPVMPFSVEENQLIENLIKVELGTSEIIPVPINVMQSLIQVKHNWMILFQVNQKPSMSL